MSNEKKDPGYQELELGIKFAPWEIDHSFQQVYQAVKSFSLVDEYRMYELWSLVHQSSKLEGALIEIGVWKGGTAGLIAAQARNCNIKDTVYLCDTFRGVVKAGPEDNWYKGGEHADTSRAMVERLLYSSLGLKNVKILEGIFPDDSGAEVANETFRFCHIDVDTYQSAADVVNAVWGQMCIGGIVVYDDYGFPGCRGVKTHVEELRDRDDMLVLYNLNGHGILIKLK